MRVRVWLNGYALVVAINFNFCHFILHQLRDIRVQYNDAHAHNQSRCVSFLLLLFFFGGLNEIGPILLQFYRVIGHINENI